MPFRSERVAAVVVAAGRSQRLGQDKTLLRLGGKPLLTWSVETLEASPLVDAIVLVVAESNQEAACRMATERGWTKLIDIVRGGASRSESVRHGLAKTEGYQWVLIHDAARPFLDQEMIERGLVAATETGAALAAVPVKDTIKVVSPDKRVLDTPPREALWAAQTPQIFRRDLIWQAHQQATGPATDDAYLLEARGQPVLIFFGSYENLKVTTPDDVELARAIAARREENADWPRV